MYKGFAIIFFPAPPDPGIEKKKCTLHAALAHACFVISDIYPVYPPVLLRISLVFPRTSCSKTDLSFFFLNLTLCMFGMTVWKMVTLISLCMWLHEYIPLWSSTMIGVSSRSQGNTARLFALSNKTGNTIQLELDSYLLSSFCLGREMRSK